MAAINKKYTVLSFEDNYKKNEEKKRKQRETKEKQRNNKRRHCVCPPNLQRGSMVVLILFLYISDLQT